MSATTATFCKALTIGLLGYAVGACANATPRETHTPADESVEEIEPASDGAAESVEESGDTSDKPEEETQLDKIALAGLASDGWGAFDEEAKQALARASLAADVRDAKLRDVLLRRFGQTLDMMANAHAMDNGYAPALGNSVHVRRIEPGSKLADCGLEIDGKVVATRTTSGGIALQAGNESTIRLHILRSSTSGAYGFVCETFENGGLRLQYDVAHPAAE